MTSNNPSIFWKIFLATVFLIAGTSFVAFISLGKIEKQARIDVGNALNTVLKATNGSHAIWIKQRKSFLNLTANKPIVISTVKKLLSKKRSKDYLQNNEQLTKLRHYFDVTRTSLNDLGFFIISRDYINMASMRDENIGITNIIYQQRPDLIEKAFNGETVFVPPITSDVPLQGKALNNSPTMFFVTPIKDNGKILALLSIRDYPLQDFTRLTQIGRIGETGETYAFNQSGQMISNSRFNHQLRQIGLLTEKDDEAILNIRIADPAGNLLDGFKPASNRSILPLTVMAQSAISGLSDINIEGYRDYRGVRVLGAWLWNPVLGYGLTTEIDEEEALKGYITSKNIILVFIVTFLLLSISLVFVIFWLEQKSRLILKQSNDTLELQVKERTAELEGTIDNLKYLQGIIPICSYCKSIRNDEGSWDMLEKYLSHNTDAKFSHGICPKCEKIARKDAGL